MFKSQDTSWQQSSQWYHNLVGSDGHYYHEHVVLPGVKRLLDLGPKSSLVDFGCGQGVLAQQIPTISSYLGIDAAASLIAAAPKKLPHQSSRFIVKDVTKPLTDLKNTFSHAVIMLALQNMAQPEGAIANAARLLESNGTLVLVLNHPCFRIPRQSGWDVDEKTKLQHRWMNRYLSPLKIPITMNPSQRQSATTWSFHLPLSAYTKMLTDHGFVITALEEWTSDKESVGKAAKMENRARSEFPLFLAIKANKLQ